MAEQLVYVVRATESGRIKIGIARNPVKRLTILQVGSPEYLELIGTAAGGRRLEVRLHAELHRDRLHGEWFEFSDHVALIIGNLLGWGKPTPLQIESARKAAELREALS
jgi:hypothetical protein